MPEDHKTASKKLGNTVYVYTDSTGDPQYAINGRRLSFLSRSIKPVVAKTLDTGDEDLAYALCDIWTDIDFQNTQNEGGISFPAGKKPEALLQRILSLFTKPADRVLDFFLGSGTTAAVAHKMGRRYIGVEQMDYGDNSTAVRLSKVIKGDPSGVSKLLNPKWKGGGSFVAFELLSATAPFEASVLSADEKTIYEVANSVSNYAVYLDYRFNAKLLTSPDFDALTLEQKKNVLMKALDKNSLYVNYSDIEDSTLVLTEADKALTHKFYGEQ